MLVVVAQQVIQVPSQLITRIRRTRERMAQVERGEPQARADARHADELAAVATQVHGAASVMQRRAGTVASGASALSDELVHQRERVRDGVLSSQDARRRPCYGLAAM